MNIDFEKRDLIPQSQDPHWGPQPTKFDSIPIPSNLTTPLEINEWKRQVVLAVAKHYIGVPYVHHHIPALGLDCSNFTSWVYNYGLGIHINSDVHKQAETAGRKLNSNEPFQLGDLLFIHHKTTDVIAHVIIYVDKDHIIDCTIDEHDGVWLRSFKTWYKKRFAFARRIIE